MHRFDQTSCIARTFSLAPDYGGARMSEAPLRRERILWASAMVALAVAMATVTLVAGKDGVVLADATDHLRHMAEASAWSTVGWSMYTQPFSEVLAASPPPCDAHRGLWEPQPAVVPPLAVLLHWPAAFAETRGWLSSSNAHAAQGAMLALLAGLALALALRLGRAESRLALLFLLATFAPLLVATSFSAFVDTAYLLAVVTALWAWRGERWAAAVAAFALAGALHVRAGVFLAPALLVTVELWRRRAPMRWPVVLASAALLAPAVVALALMTGHVSFEAANPAHWTHWHRARFWLVLAFGLVAMVGLWRARERAAAATVPSSVLLAVLDPHHGYWHAFVLLAPGLTLLGEARPGRSWVSWFWVSLFAIGAASRLYVFPLTPYWQWVRFEFV